MVTLTLNEGNGELNDKQLKELFDHCATKLPRYGHDTIVDNTH